MFILCTTLIEFSQIFPLTSLFQQPRLFGTLNRVVSVCTLMDENMGHIGMHFLIKTDSMAAAVFFSKPITWWQRHRVFKFFVWLFSLIYLTGIWILDVWISKMEMTWDIGTKWAAWKLDILPKAVSLLILRLKFRYLEKFKNCLRYFHLVHVYQVERVSI